MLAITIAWDNALSWSWENAIDALQATLRQVHIFVLMFKANTSPGPYMMFKAPFVLMETFSLKIISHLHMFIVIKY